VRHRPGSAQQLDKSRGFLTRDVGRELWVSEGPTKLSEQLLRDDELEIPVQPASQQACWDTGRCQERGNQDVGVENSSQSLPAARSRSVLSFDGEPHGVILTHTVLVPESLEEIEAEIATKRLLDDLAVPLSLPSGPHSDPAEHVFVESYCRSNLPHLCIIAYQCLRARSTSCAGVAARGLDRARSACSRRNQQESNRVRTRLRGSPRLAPSVAKPDQLTQPFSRFAA